MARINHVALKVTDLEAATKFYENVFGFRQVKTGRSRGHISRHLTDGNIDLALMEDRRAPATQTTSPVGKTSFRPFSGLVPVTTFSVGLT
jgi:catechol 2,3-dioxygenase-like lactoylglutathione lyase family enzyme